MLKIVVFDSGYGGEFFADQLEEELPIVDVIRVIDWRNADKLLDNPKEARRIAREDLRPYLGKVDLIIFANYLLTATSLKFFRRKYKEQRFIGLNLRKPNTAPKDSITILTTRAVTKTVNYYNFVFHLGRKSKTVALDSWPALIDDGELTTEEIKIALNPYLDRDKPSQEVFLFCSQFYDLKPVLTKLYGRNLKIYDGFSDTIRDVCKTLRIKGGAKKLK